MPKYINPENIMFNSLTWIDGDKDILVPLVDVRKAIAQTLAEDVVAVVRCRDCVYREALSSEYDFKGKSCMICINHHRPTKEDGYCDEGIRKH